MTTESSGPLGKPQPRVDGRLKVTGGAKYAGEFTTPGLTYGFVVSSTLARGKIKTLDTTEALAVPGVLHVFTHENRPSTAWFDRSYKDEDSLSGSPFRPLDSADVVYSGQPIALVVAETFELARHAASLVRVEYKTQKHETDLSAREDQGHPPGKGKAGFDPPPKPRGEPDKRLQKAAVQVEARYHAAVEHHNPLEMHASTVIYEDDGTLTIYDKTQGTQNSQKYVSKVFKLAEGQARVRSPFVGGAFGSGLRPQYQLFLAVMAARELKRSVRVTLTRQQMFTFGHRPETIQHVKLGASADGTLEAIIHEAVAETSRFEDYCEVVVNWSGQLYQCDHVRLDYKIVPLDQYTPLDMRAPGAVHGVYALECAMDELAAKLNLDPLELRLRNYAERDQNMDLPFSSKELKACYRQGAERFGWSKRPLAPRSMREGKHLVGWGMATGVWDAMQMPASARAVLSIDGTLTVSSATADIGTGTYTVMTQIAAQTLGLPMDAVTFKLGDSTLPFSPLEGGSWTVSSVGTAVKEVCEKLREQVLALAKKVPHSPLGKADLDEVLFSDGHVRLKEDPTRAVSLTQALRHGGVLHLEEQTLATPSPKQASYSRATHSAVFVEVKVDEDLGVVKVTRVVSAIAAGRILNPQTARSQILGAVVWGISMALHEETAVDHQLGRFMNHNLAEYHVAVNADVHDIDVIFVEEKDEVVNPLGAKGVGEIGIVGVAAAVANAIHHATGKRVRDLPITIDKLL